jgi:flagellar biosynthesis protein FlhF
MSTASEALTEATPQETTKAGERGRVYRGRTVAELIPRIQADLGPEAIVLRRRSGLEGGLGGFFQRPFVEIEARGGSKVDLYDGEAVTPASVLAAAQYQAETPAPPLATVPDFSALEIAHTPQAFAAKDDGFADALAAVGIAISDNRVNGFHATVPPAPVQPPAATAPVPAQPPAPPAPAQPPTAATAAQPEVRAPDAFVAAAYAASVGAASTPSATQEPLTSAHITTSPTPATPSTPAKSKTRQTLAAKLIATGVEERFAHELIDAAAAHALVFNPRAGLRQAVQTELQRRIPSAPSLPANGAAIVFAGPGGSGKTRCATALGAIYGRGGLNVTQASISVCAEDGSLKMTVGSCLTSPADACSARALRALAAAKAEGVVLIETPSLSPADQGAIKRLAKLLEAIAADRVVLTLPATLGARACSQLLSALAPLKPNALAITHADETDQLGVATQAACESGIAPEYMLSGGGDRALSRVDPATLTERLLR